MITTLSAVLLCAAALAAPPASRAPARPAPGASTEAVPSAQAAAALGVSTYTVSTLYTGDRYRDPFLPQTAGGAPSRPRSRNQRLVVDIHSLELHGIMNDGKLDFAIFSMENGGTLILRGRRLYDDHNKLVPGITGAIMMKQKRAELITPDKDVQIYSLGESDALKAKNQPDETDDSGSGRSP